ncbi:MAG: hypothetical protein JWN70_2004 [Planctomycetaceae bacterium]|nr:hypothetical protein [Planctomycetaceae bacterium]
MLCAVLAGQAPAAPARANVLVVVGADGAAEYGKQFREWSERWGEAAKRGGADFETIGLGDPAATTDHDVLQRRLSEFAGPGSEPLWLVFIGHGTFDGKLARFNLRGPDVALPELSAWLKAVERPLAIINCASCSGPFLNELSGPNRIVVTATKSGHEYNFSRFGDYLSAAIGEPQADLDKDDQTSLLEAYLRACARVHEFYDGDGRLMTEHALLDDNGDRLGTPSDWFQGVRAVKSAKAGASIDGQRANQWHLVRSPVEETLSPELKLRRDDLELRLAELRLVKGKVSEEEYLKQVEPLLVELAKLYESAGKP